MCIYIKSTEGTFFSWKVNSRVQSRAQCFFLWLATVKSDQHSFITTGSTTLQIPFCSFNELQANQSQICLKHLLQHHNVVFWLSVYFGGWSKNFTLYFSIYYINWYLSGLVFTISWSDPFTCTILHLSVVPNCDVGFVLTSQQLIQFTSFTS